ncbi:MAG: DUF1761 domain-containing protein [Candidatus Pacebacteria bacterium]|nr:DUF1761 domain-containing protein [Candidatus Paceibacterota bacterium]
MTLNFVAILVAAAANFMIGFMFHGPLFGKLWMRLANIVPTGNEKFSDMYGKMFMNFVANFVFAYVMAQIMIYSGVLGAAKGAIFGFWIWLGFIVTGSSMDVIWMNRSAKLWMFEIVSSLASIVAMGAILAAW